MEAANSFHNPTREPLDNIGILWRSNYQFGQPPVTLWDEMKLKLCEQYDPTFYLQQLFDQLWTISQGSSTVTEFHARFIKQKVHAGIREEPGTIVSCFIQCLHDDIKHEVCRFDPHCLEDAYCHALEDETYLRPQHSGYDLASLQPQSNSSHYRYADGV
ncbi:unnamed protein product [Prunus brigantina]